MDSKRKSWSNNISALSPDFKIISFVNRFLTKSFRNNSQSLEYRTYKTHIQNVESDTLSILYVIRQSTLAFVHATLKYKGSLMESVVP